MIIGKYKNFDEMFYEFNRKFLLNPEIVQTQLGDSGYVENIVLGCRTWDCNIDISKLAYSKKKWGHLLKNYIDYNELLDFYERLKTQSGLSITFNFKIRKSHNGNCLLSVVFVRNKSYEKWKNAKVFYRVAESYRCMAVDLVLLNRFFNELPEEYCEIKSVVFFMAQCYFDYRFAGGFIDLFDIELGKLDTENKFIKQFLKEYNKYFQKDSKLSKYNSLRQVQEMALGLTKYEKNDINELSIKNYFEKEKK